MSVSAEAASAEFERFADMMDLDLDVSNMTDEDRESYEKHRRIFERAVMCGQLTVSDDGEPTVNLKSPPANGPASLTFKEPTGDAFLTIDKGRKGQDMGKLFMMMGQLSGCDASVFSRLKQRDLKVCQTIALLFLA